MVSRRKFLTGAATFGTALCVPKSWAQTAPATTAADWRIGVANAPVDGYASSPMKQLHGQMPQGLSGRLFRNGPAWFHYGDQYNGHWFDGDGLVHRYDLSDNGVTHTGRFVETVKRRTEQERQAFVMPGFGTPAGQGVAVTGPDDVNAANTSVLPVGDEVWALWESGSPYRLRADSLETLGPKTFRDDLKGLAFLAHPKVEPSGRIWSIGVMGTQAWVWQLSADGQFEKGGLIDLPAAGYTHDWAVTENHLILPMQPLIAERASPPLIDALVWKPQAPVRVLVVEKADLSKRRVYELPAAFYFHTGDAWEEPDGTLVFDVCLADGPEFALKGAADLVRGVYTAEDAAKSYLAQVRLGSDGRATVERTSYLAEFPQTDRRFQGLKRDRVAHVTGSVAGRPGASGLAVTRWRTGHSDVFDFGAHVVVEEALFVPRPDSHAEMDGWLVGTVLNLKDRATELHVFDAGALSDGPVASWRGDHAVPLGFHGAFVRV